MKKTPLTLEITDLKKVYPNGTEALRGITFSIQKGDFFALLGPNGAGKSTTIGIISGLVGIDKYTTKNTVAKMAKSFGLAENQTSDLLKFIEAGFDKYEKEKGKK